MWYFERWRASLAVALWDGRRWSRFSTHGFRDFRLAGEGMLLTLGGSSLYSQCVVKPSQRESEWGLFRSTTSRLSVIWKVLILSLLAVQGFMGKLRKDELLQYLLQEIDDFLARQRAVAATGRSQERWISSSRLVQLHLILEGTSHPLERASLFRVAHPFFFPFWVPSHRYGLVNVT